MPTIKSPATYSILCVVGARPNFMKMAPIMAAFAALGPELDVCLVHTGQHYDVAMNHQYFEAHGIPQPDINLDVGSGSHTAQTANVMLRFESVLNTKYPSAVLVVGDVNSTLACALVAVKKGIPVIHVEAGLRSFDRAMPEEINRVLTDQISELLFITERSGCENLLREGITEDRIRFVGNVMIDTLHHNLGNAVPVSKILQNAGREEFLNGHDGYAILTAHRPSNVDDPDTLRSLLATILKISARLPIIFPMHPRTRDMIQKFGLNTMLDVPTVLQLPPMGYLEMLGLMRDARVVLTDSGGIQEETTALGIPCITLRNNTERPVTVHEGTNTIAGLDSAKILTILDQIMLNGGKAGRIPEFWDGQASTRIAAEVLDWLKNGLQSKQLLKPLQM
ncbi:MAG: UDP-N-acetylglucosamine 2-epimerase (non-hydrolyzing) [Candidatus Nitrotoga sp.]